jgi:putative DNA primase/helicase
MHLNEDSVFHSPLACRFAIPELVAVGFDNRYDTDRPLTEQQLQREYLTHFEGAVVALRRVLDVVATSHAGTAAQADYLTKVTGIAPDFESEGALWAQFLDQVTVGDAELAEYLQRVAGYCLTGDTREHALFFNYGEGANGKNTFLDALQFAFGDYAKRIPAETLMEVRGNRHPTELANLMGIRLAISNEIEEGEHWAEARLKSLTGDEMIPARFMRQDFFEFRKTHKHVIAGNHKPALRIVDEAIRRRVHLIPWRAKFDEKQRDRAMAQKLRGEAGAILAWAIRGCQRWLEEGLNPPDIVRSTTAEYLSAQDTFGQWLDECTVRNDLNASERSRRLYTSFRLWKQERGEGVPSEVRFSALLERHHARKHTNHGTMFSGITLTLAESAHVGAESAK